MAMADWKVRPPLMKDMADWKVRPPFKARQGLRRGMQGIIVILIENS